MVWWCASSWWEGSFFLKRLLFLNESLYLCVIRDSQILFLPFLIWLIRLLLILAMVRNGCKYRIFCRRKSFGKCRSVIFLKDKIGDEDFLLLNADAVFDVDFNRMVKYHRSHNALVTLFTHTNSHPYNMSDGTLWEVRTALWFRQKHISDCAAPVSDADYQRDNRRLS